MRRRIGSGGFATVWLAYDEQLDSPVAVKVLADNWTEDHHVRGRFLEEGRFLRKVESPHVVSVYDAGELDDGRPYLVMSYADQGTLADRLEVEGLTVAQAMEVVRQVGAGLEALHARQVLHRDVKPANVLFRTVDSGAAAGGPGGVRVMLGDLGLGKAIDVSSRLTMIAGTPTFVAPEQALGEHLDPRADQYSLAAITYLLLTGRPPFQHATLAAAGDPGPAPSLSTADRSFPAELDEVVRRGLAPARADRWPDVASYVAALESAVGETAARTPTDAWLPLDPQLTQPGARPSPPPVAAPLLDPDLPRSRHRRWWGALAAVVALLAGTAGGIAVERSQRSDVTVRDASGTIRVTVPWSWGRAQGIEAWQPPNAEGHYPALSVGTSESWSEGADTDDQGVFAALFPGTAVPELIPQHAECLTAEDPVGGSADEPATTVVFTGCPGGVIVERVVQVAANRLLWVQVRSADRATANDVLDSVETSGL